jgi:hypothetical protein
MLYIAIPRARYGGKYGARSYGPSDGRSGYGMSKSVYGPLSAEPRYEIFRQFYLPAPGPRRWGFDYPPSTHTALDGTTWALNDLVGILLLIGAEVDAEITRP